MVIKFIQDLGIRNIENYETQILEYGLEKLRKDNSINIITDFILEQTSNRSSN